jgi:hypothetical protein
MKILRGIRKAEPDPRLVRLYLLKNHWKNFCLNIGKYLNIPISLSAYFNTVILPLMKKSSPFLHLPLT